MSAQLDLNEIANLEGPVLFVGFHPDDIDFHAGGLAALLIAHGADVKYVVVTSGEGGGSASVRENEQRSSAAAVGVLDVRFLRMRDGRLARAYHCGRLQKLMSSLIREMRPSTIVSFCPANLTSVTWGAEHPDHRYGAMALWDAIYPHARADERWRWWRFWRKPLAGHKVAEVLWFGDDLAQPHSGNCFVAIDTVWAETREALSSHPSQWDAETIDKAHARATRAAKRWDHEGLAEEYHRVSFL
ncbi:MAG: hypothetical protein C0507_00420 [Cyanobacteria bacterium PR.3.49]|nr:hypothetical protein [Cyanobacteria bacterium PR.3.49]